MDINFFVTKEGLPTQLANDLAPMVVKIHSSQTSGDETVPKGGMLLGGSVKKKSAPYRAFHQGGNWISYGRRYAKL